MPQSKILKSFRKEHINSMDMTVFGSQFNWPFMVAIEKKKFLNQTRHHLAKQICQKLFEKVTRWQKVFLGEIHALKKSGHYKSLKRSNKILSDVIIFLFWFRKNFLLVKLLFIRLKHISQNQNPPLSKQYFVI